MNKSVLTIDDLKQVVPSAFAEHDEDTRLNKALWAMAQALRDGKVG